MHRAEPARLQPRVLQVSNRPWPLPPPAAARSARAAFDAVCSSLARRRRKCITEHLAGAGQSQCPTCGVPAVPGDMVTHFQFRDTVETWQTLGLAAGATTSPAAADEPAMPADEPAVACRVGRGEGEGDGDGEGEDTDDDLAIQELKAKVARRSSAGARRSSGTPAAAAADSEPDWMHLPSSDRDRPETPEGYGVLDSDLVDRQPPTTGAEVKFLVNNRWVRGEVTKCHDGSVDVRFTSGKTRLGVSHTDRRLLFQTHKVVKYQSSSTKKRNSRLSAGRSRPSVGKTATPRCPSSSSHNEAPQASDPYAFHTGDTQAQDAGGASNHTGRSSHEEMPEDQDGEADQDSANDSGAPAVSLDDGGQIKSMQKRAQGRELHEQQDEEQQQQHAQQQEQQQSEEQQAEEQQAEEQQAEPEQSQSQAQEVSIEEAETQAFVAVEDEDDVDDETLNLADASAESAAVPIGAAAGLSPTAPLVSDVPASVVPPSGGGADILVADSEGSDAVESASEAQVKASEDIHLSSVAAAASPANENAPPAQSRASHGSTVTFAADDEVDVKELSQEACSQSVTNSCPQIGEETQAQLEEFLGEASCPMDDDDSDTDGAALAAQAAKALHVKNMIEKAAQKNNRALDRLAQRRKRSSPPAETDRPEKQQRTDTLQQPPPHVAEHSSDDVSQDLMCPKPRRAADEAGSDAAGGLPAAASRHPSHR